MVFFGAVALFTFAVAIAFVGSTMEGVRLSRDRRQEEANIRALVEAARKYRNIQEGRIPTEMGDIIPYVDGARFDSDVSPEAASVLSSKYVLRVAGPQKDLVFFPREFRTISDADEGDYGTNGVDGVYIGILDEVRWVDIRQLKRIIQ